MEAIKDFCKKRECLVNGDLFISKTIDGKRGIYATQDILKGQVLFKQKVSIQPDNEQPPFAFLSYVMSFRTTFEIAASRATIEGQSPLVYLKFQAFQEFQTVNSHLVNHFLGTTVALMLERLCYKKTGQSYFSKYLDWLPQRSEGVCRWKNEDLEFVKDTTLAIEANVFINSSISTFQQIFRHDSLPKFFQFLSAAEVNLNELWDIFNDAASLVQAYSFTVFLEEEDCYRNLLVPLMDALNADETKANVLLFDNIDGSFLTLEGIAVKNIKKDEELFNSFGEMSESQRLIKYGYIDETDSIEVSFILSNNTIVSVSNEDLNLIKNRNFSKNELKIWLAERNIVNIDIFVVELAQRKLHLSNILGSFEVTIQIDSESTHYLVQKVIGNEYKLCCDLLSILS